MRMFKFRLWENDRYLYKDFFDRNWYATPYNDDNGANCVRALMPRDSIYKLEQYTGLKDKNGVEIYEGDIVKVSDNGWRDDINTYEVYYGIEWGYPAFDLKDHTQDLNLLSYYNENGELEVIGNIHENIIFK